MRSLVLLPALLVLALLLLAPTASWTQSPQLETFDIATFVPPAGWNRAEANGILLLQDRRILQGRAIFCQIYLFPSQPSYPLQAFSFQFEWDRKVAKPLGLTPLTKPESESTSDGWHVFTGRADYLRQGVPMRTILVTAVGFGKVASVMVTVSPNSYEREVEEFFKNLNFNANVGRAVRGPANGGPANPGPANGGPANPGGAFPSGQSTQAATAGASGGGSLASYLYAIPPQWTRGESPQGIVLASPVFNNGEHCQLMMLPLHAASQPLADEAIRAFADIFKADPLSTYPSPPPRLARGTSPQGWDYFLIRKLVGGQEGESRTQGATLLKAKVGDQIATIVGMSKDFMVSQCFGLLRADVWPAFFYGLQFKEAQASTQSRAALQQRLAGTWTTATATVGLGYTFQANGRYATTGTTRYAYPALNGNTTQTTQAFFGDGAYSFDGNTIILTGDDHRRSTQFFRLQQVSTDSGQRWQDELCLMDQAGGGEVCYRRDR
jgi:hypothetical protein